MQNMEKYFGFKVSMIDELDPVRISALKEKANKIIAQYNFNVDEYFVYFHCISLDKTKDEYFGFGGGIATRLKRLELKFSVNQKQLKHRSIKIFNYLLDDDVFNSVVHYGGLDSFTYHIGGDYLAQHLGFKNELVTFISKKVRESHRKLKISVTALPTDEFSHHIFKNTSAHLTQLDYKFRKPIILRKPQDNKMQSDLTNGQSNIFRSEFMTSVLFLASDPTDASRLRLGEEFREIQEKLKISKLRDNFDLKLPQLSIRPEDISQALLDFSPQIVHFSGHGSSNGAICVENKIGKIHSIQPDALASLFEQFSSQVSCVLLNACYSHIQAEEIAKHIKYVIGMSQAIGDKAAIAFTVGFYQALGAGRTIEDAYKLGCVQIRLQNIDEHLTPVLISKQSMGLN